MAFCTSCGAPLEGAFCTKCGAKAGAPSAPGIPAPEAAPAGSPIVIPPQAGKTPRKGRLLFWILGGCLGLIVLAAILSFVTGAYIFKRLGFDSSLAEKKPELAVAKMMISANPDLEILSMDESTGVIRIRNKKTGESLTVNMEDVKSGKITFTDDRNRKVEIQSQGEGDNASLSIQSDQGAMRMGANAAIQLPSWLPAYPGAAPAGMAAFTQENGKSGSCAYKSNDSAEEVVAFYEKALKNGGFNVQKKAMPGAGQGSMVVLEAFDEATQRKATVYAVRSEADTMIHLSFTDH
ncbi:MAG: zinc ribbon domain-containing protein [Acidobacteriota bacterium]|nr:zinc ribbon domain-containing protein [Acidobacteriota bacterium]